MHAQIDSALVAANECLRRRKYKQANHIAVDALDLITSNFGQFSRNERTRYTVLLHDVIARHYAYTGLWSAVRAHSKVGLDELEHLMPESFAGYLQLKARLTYYSSLGYYMVLDKAVATLVQAHELFAQVEECDEDSKKGRMWAQLLLAYAWILERSKAQESCQYLKEAYNYSTEQGFTRQAIIAAYLLACSHRLYGNKADYVHWRDRLPLFYLSLNIKDAWLALRLRYAWQPSPLICAKDFFF